MVQAQSSSALWHRVGPPEPLHHQAPLTPTGALHRPAPPRRLGVEFVKRPNDGKMKGLAFVKDPDGYWIEILNPEVSKSFGSS